MSDTNRVGLRFFRSSQRTAPIPGGPFNLEQLRFTGTPNLAFVPTTIVSEEIRPDRQITDLILVGAEAGGDTGIEISYGAFDDLITGALFNVFTETVIKQGTGEITAFGAGTIDVDVGGDFIVGQIFRIEELATGDLGDGIFEITGIAVNVLTVNPLAGTATTAVLGTETADADTKMQVSGFAAQISGDISVTVGGGDAVFQFPAGALDNALGTGVPITIGAWMKAQDFATVGNNVWFRVREVDLTADTVTTEAQTGMATDAAGTEQVQIFYGSRVENGAQAIAAHQFAVERRFEDHSPITRELFLGMALNNFNITLAPQAIAVGSLTWFGFNSAVSDASPAYADLYAALPVDVGADQNDVYNTSNDIGRLGRGVDPVDAAGQNFVLEATIEINNNLRRQPAVGVFGASGIGVGELSVTGTLSTYFDNDDILQAILTNAETTLDLITQGADGRSQVYDMPRIKFSGGAPDVPGKNQDVTIPGTYQAILSPVFGYTISHQTVSFAR
ncbi:MAG: hypothetical protein KAI80_04260 [Hyphomicrobiaceae bacterium]|nr:hypothetical protein [Hyphomicrobiaceae bacterium]